MSLSNSKAKLIIAIKEIMGRIWLQCLMNKLAFDKNPNNSYSDSQNVIHLLKNLVFYDRSKHINFKMHLIRDIIEKGLISIKKTATSLNLIDSLTKPLAL